MIAGLMCPQLLFLLIRSERAGFSFSFFLLFVFVWNTVGMFCLERSNYLTLGLGLACPSSSNAQCTHDQQWEGARAWGIRELTVWIPMRTGRCTTIVAFPYVC